MIVRFFRSDAMSERLGEVDDYVIEYPNEFAQLTYNELRDFDGMQIAHFDSHDDVWQAKVYNADRTAFEWRAYSDIVIAGDESPLATA